MNSLGIVGWLLGALGGATSLAESSTSTTSSRNQRTIEILVAGPEAERNLMLATIQPLLAGDPDLYWVTQPSLPAEDTLPPSSDDGNAHIWIDLSDLTQLRVYIPESARGGTAVRTLASAGSGAEDVEPMAREAVAQIVKASVLALRAMPMESEEAVPPTAVESPHDENRTGNRGVRRVLKRRARAAIRGQ